MADGGVAELVREGRLVEAAERCLAAGDAAQASDLFERACDYGAAARASLTQGANARAMMLAVRAGDEDLVARARRAVVELEPPDKGKALAAEFAARGELQAAAALFGELGAHAEAATALERAGDPLGAARSFVRAGRAPGAARVLEASLRGRPDDEVRLELGRLYASHGRHEHALRALQAIDPDSAMRSEAVPLIAQSLEALGLHDALRELGPELEAARTGTGATGAAGSPADEASHLAPTSADGAREVLYGRYEVVREVATTPHARILECVDRLTGAHVALKLLAAIARGTGRDARERFEREARVLAALRHPSVVPLHEFIADGPAMVLAWMPGGDLRALCQREVISPARAVEIASALLAALGEAHRRGILHRDVKPSNVLFDAIGAPRLADFGAAHLGGADATATAAEIGTLGYMAPEQRLGRAATVRSDVYGVGAVLFEMLTGRLPEPAAPVRPSALQPDLDARHDAVLAGMLAVDPAARFEDAERARLALASVPWPKQPPARKLAARAAMAAPTSAPPSAEGRLGSPTEIGAPAEQALRRHDRWIDRDVLIVPYDELPRAGAFARAAHPALACVWRADAAARQLWIEAARGEPLGRSGAPRLDAREVERLSSALERLHAAGGVHGAVDADHVYRVEGEVWLAYPLAVGADASPASDRACLAALAGGTPS